MLPLLLLTGAAAQNIGDGFVTVYRGSCATRSEQDEFIVSSHIPRNEECHIGSYSFGLLAEHDFRINCLATGKLELFVHGEQCSPAAALSTTQCADGVGKAHGLYHVFSCATPAAELDLAESDEELRTETPSLSGFDAAAVCSTKTGTTNEQCTRKIRQCAKEAGIGMKWVGTGCVSSSGERFGDGGCQCDGYCGFNCKAACNNDKQCTWSAEAKACLVKKTGAVGVPIHQCL